MTTAPNPQRRPSSWLFWLPLMAQALLILATPVQAIYTQVTGKTVILQTGPVDPYDLLRGYYVVLSYDISALAQMQQLPGWDEVEANLMTDSFQPPLTADGAILYVVLEAPTDPQAEPPQPWTPVRVSSDRPTNLPTNQIALRGNYRYGTINYGLETYYIPEDQRVEINDDINQAQWSGGERPFVVEIKVNAQGEAVPISLWVDDHNYRF